ncbi:hypothetical protein MN116_007829 [Schistosoma mekongi]|uniref:SCP domain-containing protein n=1 Tax=Schistosoma mekongi TaxID=38744 RepID=A0AAE1Z7P3_SCHME|nr:hypothetical protein MN116_007829 [Schistosoma mekongi]
MLTLLLVTCLVDVIVGEIGTGDMQILFQLHNEQREDRNSCEYTEIVPAEETLNPLTWDSELAADAQRFADQCEEYVKPPVRSVGSWESVGQNAREVVEVADAVRLWMKEAKYYNHESDTCQAGHDCDSYKQIVQVETTHIGCAAKWCSGLKSPLNFLVVCNYSPSLGNQLEMSTDENLLLYYHNYIRRERNTCDSRTSIPADVKLNDYIWDYSLHETAQQYAKQCENHPSSMQYRTTCRWKSVGQNIAKVNSIQNAIEQWRNEHRYYDFTTDSCQANHNCYVYKQIVNSNTTHIGCAIQLCNESMSTGKYLIVCNYAPAAGEGRPYDDARKSRCKQ